MLTTQAVLDTAGTILRIACPLDFPQGVGIYVVPWSKLERHGIHPNGHSCEAFTGGDLDLKLADHMGPDWQGRGFACVINDLELPTAAAEAMPQVLGLVVHEAAHWLQLFPWLHLGEVQDCVRKRTAWNHSSVETVAYFNTPAGREADHGAEFIRASLHVWKRVSRHHPLPLSKCGIAGEFYGFAPAMQYAVALGTELNDCGSTSIANILNGRPPDAFLDLWRREFRPGQTAKTADTGGPAQPPSWQSSQFRPGHTRYPGLVLCDD